MSLYEDIKFLGWWVTAKTRFLIIRTYLKWYFFGREWREQHEFKKEEVK
jgi:hypothetical protein